MDLIRFGEMHLNSFLSSLVNTGAPISFGLIIGALIFIVVLVLVLVILLVKSIKNIEGLTKNLNDKSDYDTLQEDSIIEDDNINDKYTYDDNTSIEYDGDTNDLDSENYYDSRMDTEKHTDQKVLVPDVPDDTSDSDLISYLDKLVIINDELEPYGFAYDSDTKDFYSTMYPWQRHFGYCRLYDEGAPALGLIFDSEPIYFDYNGKHWLIQFWKGQYGITTGAEIGVYNSKSKGLNIPGLFNGRFYHAVDNSERLEIEFSLIKDNEVITKRKGLHWWLSSFILGEFTNPHELTMYIEIHFPNTIMRDSFTNGLINTGYSRNDYAILDNVVYIVFDTPHTSQPHTRTDFVEELMQENNKQNVQAFNKATESFTNIIDKLYILRQDSPDYYKEVLKIGKPKQLYGIYNTIKSYLD